MAHRRVSRYPGAQQRRGTGQFEFGRNSQDEMFIDDDAVGVAAVSDASEMFVRKVVRECYVRTELLKARFAFGQVRSESTRQPTAARSPGLNLLTAEPTLVTRPTIS